MPLPDPSCLLLTKAASLGKHPAITTSHTYKELPFFVSPWHAERDAAPILLNRQFKNTVDLLNTNLTHYTMGFGAAGVGNYSSNRAALDYFCMTRDVSHFSLLGESCVCTNAWHAHTVSGSEARGAWR